MKKPKRLEIIPFTLPLHSSLSIRHSLLCKITYEEGIAYGEAAPLPGFSLETHLQAFEQLQEIKKGLEEGKEIPFSSLFPSVHFALSHPIFEKEALPFQKVHAFLQGPFDKIVADAKEAIANGFTTLKIKIHQLSHKEIETLLSQLSQKAKLRIDCNRAFTVDEANALFGPLKESIDYIEEPSFEIPKLKELTFPFAIDETLREKRALPNSPYLKALIIKPTLMGGYERLLPWITLSKKRNLKLIASPAYESGVGLLQILHLFSGLVSKEDPMGLDTYSYIEKDILQYKIEKKNGYFFPPKIIQVENALCFVHSEDCYSR